MRVDDSRIRKEKVADSKISGYVWTGPKLVFASCLEQHMNGKARARNCLMTK